MSFVYLRHHDLSSVDKEKVLRKFQILVEIDLSCVFMNPVQRGITIQKVIGFSIFYLM